MISFDNQRISEERRLGGRNSGGNEKLHSLGRGLSICGLILSLYMLWTKYSGSSSFCDLNEIISCSVINVSQYSLLFGVPLAAWGIFWFSFLLFLHWRGYSLHQNISMSAVKLHAGNDIARIAEYDVIIMLILLWSAAGGVFLTYLLAAEFILGAICPVCTGVHILTAILLGLSVRLFQPRRESLPSFSFFIASTRPYFVALFGLALFLILCFNFLHTSSVGEAQIRTSDDLIHCFREQHLVLYVRTGCKFCRQQEEILGKELWKVLKHIDCGQDSCDHLNLEGYPTWIVEKDGKEVRRHLGLLSLPQLKQFCNHSGL